VDGSFKFVSKGEGRKTQTKHLKWRNAHKGHWAKAEREKKRGGIPNKKRAS